MQISLNYFDIAKARKGETLIVGSKLYGERDDRRLLYKRATGVDMLKGEGVDIVHNLEHAPMPQQYAHVECMSVLEHSKSPWLCAQHIEDSMIPDGTIFLTVPFIWRFHGYPSDYFRFTKEGVKALFSRIDWLALDYVSGDILIKQPLSFELNKQPFFQRCEVFGIGVRK